MEGQRKEGEEEAGTILERKYIMKRVGMQRIWRGLGVVWGVIFCTD